MDDSVMERLILQAIISRGSLLEQDMLELYDRARSACDVAPGMNLTEYVKKLNSKLQGLGLKVGAAKMEDCHEVWYALVNSSPDAAAKIGSKFTPSQLEFFNKIVKYLILEEGVVSSTQLLNVTSEMERKKLSPDEAQKFMKSLVKQHWLKEEAGKVSAGPRFILELRPFLTEIYGERVPHCKICKEPVIKGQSCHNCDVKIHLLCVAMLADGRIEIRCPGCHDQWLHEIPDIPLPIAAQTNGSGSSASSKSSRVWEKSSQHKRPRKDKKK